MGGLYYFCGPSGWLETGLSDSILRLKSIAVYALVEKIIYARKRPFYHDVYAVIVLPQSKPIVGIIFMSIIAFN